MPISGAMQEQYEENRIKYAAVNKNFKLYFGIQLALGIAFAAFSMFAGASSTLHEDVHGASKFYYAMDAGIIQILLGVASIILGFITAAKKRIGSFILLVLYLGMLIYTLAGSHVQLQVFNSLLLAGGLVANIWIQTVFGTQEYLKGQPGYPHFSVLMEEKSHYESPVYVTHRQSADHMDTVGGAPAQESAVSLTKSASGGSLPTPEQQAQLQETAFSEMTVPERKAAPAVSVPKPNVTLESFDASAQKAAEKAAEKQKKEMLERQHALEAAMLADMTPETAAHHSEGDVSMLPTPEEVRARMAAMKKARENGGI